MKVLHLINTLSAGGAELHLLTLSRYLKEQGLEIIVACLREHVRGSRSLRNEFERANIKVVKLQAESRYDWRFLIKLKRLLRIERPDLVHTHLPRADIAAALLQRVMHLPPLLCSVHGLYRHRWFGLWAAPFMRWAYRQADGIIAISFAVKNWLEQDYGVSTDKVSVIHYGIELEPFTYPKEDIVRAWPRAGRTIIGSIGRLEAGKGFDCLIRAMPLVQRHIPHALLLIAGHDLYGYTQTLEQMITEFKLDGCVRLVGFQSDVPSFMHTFDVFAFASRSEGFGQVVIEAMAAGKPVVASRIPPLTEIIRDGETGLLANPDDPQDFANAIVRLLTHPEQAQQMGIRALERVYDHFSARRMADETLSVYTRLVQASRHGRTCLT